MTITIRPLTQADNAVLQSLISGYVSTEKYHVLWQDTDEGSTFTLRLKSLASPYVKQFQPEDAEYYESIIGANLSLAAYDAEVPVALALSTVHTWNQSFWIHEFHVAKAHHGRGIGRLLMDAVKALAIAQSCRTIICETQNTNVPAIRFYRRMGFRIEAVDVSLYANDDYPDREIALFMKCRLDGGNT